jgi:uncharacterized protein (DUF2267 family)
MNPYHILEQLIDLERRAHAIYRVLTAPVGAAEMVHVKRLLPAALRSLWPDTADEPATS